MNPDFPSPGVVLPGLDPNAKQQGAYEGMSLRAYMAVRFAAALMHPGVTPRELRDRYATDSVSEAACQQADRLLEELAK